MSLRALRLGLRRLFRRDRVERELSDEVAHLFDLTVAEHERQGMSRDEAERATRLQLGGVESIKEHVRAFGWDARVDTLWRDIRHGVGGLRRQLTFTCASTLTLALGIGATTAMFSVVYGVLLRPLPYQDSRRLVLLWTDDVKRGLHNESTAYSTILDWQRETQSFADIAFFSTERATLGTNESRERTRTAFTSANLLPLVGVPPMNGRWLSQDDERMASPVAVISHSLWQRRFASDPDILGTPILFDDWQGKGAVRALTIVGVMPPTFFFPDRQTEIWVPATAYWRWTRESTERFPSWARRWTGIARLNPHVSVADARADLARVAARLHAVHGAGDPDFPGFAVNVVLLLDSIAGPRLQLALWLLMGAVVLVLLVACANVGNLLLARAAARQHEIAVRRALGASRLRLLQQLFVESLLLASLGGTLGVLLAAGATRLLSMGAADRLPRIDQIAVDIRVLAFAAVMTAVSSVLFGLLPALRVTDRQAAMWLKDASGLGGGPRIRRARAVLVVVECSLAVVLLVGAGLLLRSLARVHAVEPGFTTANVLVVRLEFPREPPVEGVEPPTSGATRATARAQTLQDLLARLTVLPAVESAGFVDDMFIAGQGNESVTFPGRDPSIARAGELNEAAATSGFFSTMRVPLRQGRYLVPDDTFTKIRALWTPLEPGLTLAEKARRAVAEPVVVNEAFAGRFLAGSDPIGERFCIDPMNKTYCYEIVGVIGDMHRQGPERVVIPEYFGPLIPSGSSRADLLLRTRGDPTAAAGSVRAIVNDVIPGTLVPVITTADAAFGQFVAQRRFQTSLLTVFATLALLLAAVGIFGIVHFAVAQRMREIAVRIALGARPRDVVWLVLVGGMRLPLVGLAVGLLISIGAARVMSQLLFGIGATDLVTVVAVAATLTGAALAACYAPARRAARLDAVAALRLE
jgi:putative ABC transport system permease protein